MKHIIGGRLSARCDRCLGSSPIVGGDGELVELGWELRADEQTWCVDCSRKAREVKFPTNSRGVRRKSRW